MKKIILFFVMLAITFGASIASADRVYVPWVTHRGDSNYTQVQVVNLSSEVVSITVRFVGGTTFILDSSGMKTNTHGGTTSITSNIAGGNTWEILTTEAALFSSTTSRKRALVDIQSSADDRPEAGPIGAHAFFVNVTGSAPSGFMFPVAYRVQSTYTWGSGAGTIGTSSDNWRQ